MTDLIKLEDMAIALSTEHPDLEGIEGYQPRVPTLKLCQALTPEVQEGVARPGDLLLTPGNTQMDKELELLFLSSWETTYTNEDPVTKKPVDKRVLYFLAVEAKDGKPSGPMFRLAFGGSSARAGYGVFDTVISRGAHWRLFSSTFVINASERENPERRARYWRMNNPQPKTKLSDELIADVSKFVDKSVKPWRDMVVEAADEAAGATIVVSDDAATSDSEEIISGF